MKRLLIALAVATVLVGCDSPERTVERTRQQISAYQAAPDSKKQAEIEASLDKLDTQVARMEKSGDEAGASALRRQTRLLRNDFQAAILARTINDTSKAIQGIGDAFKDLGKTFSETFKDNDTNSKEP